MKHVQSTCRDEKAKDTNGNDSKMKEEVGIVVSLEAIQTWVQIKSSGKDIEKVYWPSVGFLCHFSDTAVVGVGTWWTREQSIYRIHRLPKPFPVEPIYSLL